MSKGIFLLQHHSTAANLTEPNVKRQRCFHFYRHGSVFSLYSQWSGIVIFKNISQNLSSFTINILSSFTHIIDLKEHKSFFLASLLEESLDMSSYKNYHKSDPFNCFGWKFTVSQYLSYCMEKDFEINLIWMMFGQKHQFCLPSFCCPFQSFCGEKA